MTDVVPDPLAAALPGQKCTNCNAFYTQSNGRTVCRAHPPVAMFSGYTGTDVKPENVFMTTTFPAVDADDWCREWQQKT